MNDLIPEILKSCSYTTLYYFSITNKKWCNTVRNMVDQLTRIYNYETSNYPIEKTKVQSLILPNGSRHGLEIEEKWNYQQIGRNFYLKDRIFHFTYYSFGKIMNNMYHIFSEKGQITTNPLTLTQTTLELQKILSKDEEGSIVMIEDEKWKLVGSSTKDHPRWIRFEIVPSGRMYVRNGGGDVIEYTNWADLLRHCPQWKKVLAVAKVQK